MAVSFRSSWMRRGRALQQRLHGPHSLPRPAQAVPSTTRTHAARASKTLPRPLPEGHTAAGPGPRPATSLHETCCLLP